MCAAGVQSAAVNVICELARKNPKNYLSLAPLFFKLMTSSTNNWVLIKIIKLVMYYSSPCSPCCITIVRDMIVSLLTFMNRSCSVVVGVGLNNGVTRIRWVWLVLINKHILCYAQCLPCIVAAVPPPFRPGNPAVCGSRPLVTAYSVD